VKCMQSGAYKIAMGVIVTAMGVAMIPITGPLGFAQVLAGGLLVYVGALRLKDEKKT
jgi:hypothetical protein